MTKITTYAADAQSTQDALSMLDQSIGPVRSDARMVFAFYDCRHDDTLIHSYLKDKFANAPLIGGTSSGGVITEKGFFGDNAIGLLCIDDADGDYGCAAGFLGEDPAGTAERLLHEALGGCNCTGEIPELIWIYQTPGHEEDVLEGLRRVIGDGCPIVGGSSADNDVSGQWRQLGPHGALADGLVVAVLFPSNNLTYAFQGGYEPTGESGVVTGIGFKPSGSQGTVTANAGREILTIDGRPAASVYNEWIGGHIEAQLATGGTILAETTMFPIATDAGSTDGVINYLLIHPEGVTGEGALRTFCRLDQGARVFAMKGDKRQLVDRAGRVAERARNQLSPLRSQIAGALVVYCGGCKLAIGDGIRQVASSIHQALNGAPFIGCFTFGEQGRILDQNVHGNLMISATAFGA